MKKPKIERTALCLMSLYFSLPAAVVALMVRFGPSSVDSAYPAWFGSWLAPILVSVTGASLLAFVMVLSSKSLARFFGLLAGTGMALVALSIAAGMLVHRDFFTATFQYLLCVPAVFFAFILNGKEMLLSKSRLRAISRTGFVLAGFYAQWIMLMGYAIATRAEPRPIESIIYNIYNLVLVFLLFFASRSVGRASLNTIRTGAQTLIVNGRDISAVAGQKKTLLVHALSSAPERRLRCPELQRILHPDTIDANSDCLSCAEANRKAAMCSRYRTTYNVILETKKLLEFLEIGTITSGDNRRNILRDGWKMVLFENVRMETKKMPEPDKSDSGAHVL